MFPEQDKLYTLEKPACDSTPSIQLWLHRFSSILTCRCCFCWSHCREWRWCGCAWCYRCCGWCRCCRCRWIITCGAKTQIGKQLSERLYTYIYRMQHNSVERGLHWCQSCCWRQFHYKNHNQRNSGMYGQSLVQCIQWYPRILHRNKSTYYQYWGIISKLRQFSQHLKLSFQQLFIHAVLYLFSTNVSKKLFFQKSMNPWKIHNHTQHFQSFKVSVFLSNCFYAYRLLWLVAALWLWLAGLWMSLLSLSVNYYLRSKKWDRKTIIWTLVYIHLPHETQFCRARSALMPVVLLTSVPLQKP